MAFVEFFPYLAREYRFSRTVRPHNKELTRLKNSLSFWRLPSDYDLSTNNTLSHTFKTGDNQEFTWESTLIKTSDLYRFSITLRNCNVPEIEANCNIVVNQRQPQCKHYTLSKILTFCKNGKELLFATSYESLLQINGIGFEITVNGVENNFEKQLSEVTGNTLKDFKRVFDDKTFSDATFVTPGGTIQAHKAILAAGSSVFAKMFVENSGNEFEVPDNHDAFEVLLCFLYTGTIHKSERCIIEPLLELSEKYALDDLKTICKDVLYNTLTLANVLATLKLCETHNMMELKQKALEYVAKNGKDIIHSENFREFMKSDVNIALEIVRFVVVPKRRDAIDNSFNDVD